jgi:hypothetical protein
VRIPVAITIALAIAGCGTPYQKNSMLSRGGYEEEKIDENSYHLTYIGNGYTNQEQVNEMWLRRANELCNGTPKDATPSTSVKSTEMTSTAGGAFIESHPHTTVAVGTVVCK